PKGVADPDVFMVRAVSLRLPPEDSWIDSGAPFMRAKLGADFGYEL
ncbi:ring-hydroxylating oxygenase subunit alpha, partial [Salmonella enterica subsp. enterica serovar Enteritidis]|nr:ring-hydroxylating oxygenase subunit alpha [Salmonella enterica subsp. enterica serovar Enteritidis]